ncbi:MAG: hypothetical protein GXX86_08555 [Propionibacterium sp.]|nr:hypothetical protein [Propionibacterium sp.]
MASSRPARTRTPALLVAVLLTASAAGCTFPPWVPPGPPEPTPTVAAPSPGSVDCAALEEWVRDEFTDFAPADEIEVNLNSASCRRSDPERAQRLIVDIGATDTTSAADLIDLVDTFAAVTDDPQIAPLTPELPRLRIEAYGHLTVWITGHPPAMGQWLAAALAAAADDETSDITFNVTIDDGEQFSDVPPNRRRLIAHPDEPADPNSLDAVVGQAWGSVAWIADEVGWPGEISVHFRGVKWLLPIPPGSVAPAEMADYAATLHALSSGVSVEAVSVSPTREGDGLMVRVSLDHATVPADEQRLTPPEQRLLDDLVRTMEGWDLGEVDTWVGLVYE